MEPSFKNFDLRPSTMSALARMGFETPTPVQSQAIPLLLQGEDVIAQARTGTGKTAAFGIPMVEKVKGRSLQSLVLAPTRELANQIADELNAIGEGSAFRAFPVYGGVGFRKQIDAANGRMGVTCLVACPGRLLDLLERGEVNLRDVNMLVLDEADRMLDMGFIRDIEKIFAYLPKERQSMLFSATIPPEIRKLSNKYLQHPESIKAEEGSLATPLTEQFKVEVMGEGIGTLLALIRREEPDRAVVFTSTKHTARRVSAKLSAAGITNEALQGNMSQGARDRAMKLFRQGKIRVLVATDVAARGIDVAELTHVIQFDLPTTPDDYVHRAGRTGRAGQPGRAFVFAQPNDMGFVKDIEVLAGVPINAYKMGDIPDVPPHVAQAGPPPRRYESVTAGGRGQNPTSGGGGYRPAGIPYGGPKRTTPKKARGHGHSKPKHGGPYNRRPGGGSGGGQGGGNARPPQARGGGRRRGGPRR